MRRLRYVLVLSAALLVTTVAQAAPIGTLKQFKVPTPNAEPLGITRASDGNFWFTESQIHHVGRITPAGAITEFLVCQFCFPTSIVQGGDGNFYFTSNDGLGRITPEGVVTALGPPPVVIGNRVAARGDDVWFTDFNNDLLWRYSISGGEFTSFPLPGQGTVFRVPDGVAVDANGVIWIADFGANSLLRRAVDGTFTEFPIPDGSANGPRELTIATDGKIWFTKRFDHSVGFLDPANANAITLFPLAAGRGPEGIAASPDGSVWFAQSVAGNVARITNDGVVTEGKVVKGSEPFGVAVAANGDPWYTEVAANKIAVLQLR